MKARGKALKSAKTVVRVGPKKTTRPTRAAKKPAPAARPQRDGKGPPPLRPADAGIDAIRKDVAGLRSLIEGLRAPVPPSDAARADEVDALRRLLGDLIEGRMEAVVRELVAVRNAAAAMSNREGIEMTAQLDRLLAEVGGVKFDAELLDHVDPLIHAVSRESLDERIADGVVVECLRPGYRTGRGVVVAKALVAVNRRG